MSDPRPSPVRRAILIWLAVNAAVTLGIAGYHYVDYRVKVARMQREHDAEIRSMREYYEAIRR